MLAQQADVSYESTQDRVYKTNPRTIDKQLNDIRHNIANISQEELKCMNETLLGPVLPVSQYKVIIFNICFEKAMCSLFMGFSFA